MKSKTRAIGGIQGMEWVAGCVVVLLLTGAGLVLFAQRALGKEASEASAAVFLLALYWASWVYLLGLLGLLFLSVRWLGDWWHARVARVATPPVPSRSPGESDDRNQAPKPSRVA